VHARNKVEPLELLLDPHACRAARQAVQRGVVTERLGHREVEIERRLLEDETAAGEGGVASARQVVTEHADRSLLQIEQPCDQREQRRLSGAVEAEQDDEVAGLDRKRDSPQRRLAVGVADAMDLECAHLLIVS
jgi:hypothetical protein